MTDLLVYNIEAATPSMLRSLDRHCRDREPNGASAIDPARSHLNRILVGREEGVLASLEQLYESGVQRPAKQSESPYLRIVVSASASYFRPDDPSAVGTWDQDRLDTWLDATMDHLRKEHGDDLVYTELHLDEDTPHVHAVIAPTYTKKPRKPGRRKRNETEEEFAVRQAAAETAIGVRTVGRASHPELSKKGSFQRLRERMAVAVDHLGIEYGEDRQVDAPPGQSTREWVKQKAAELAEQKGQLEAERAALQRERRAVAEERVAITQERHILDDHRRSVQELAEAATRRYEKNEAVRLELAKIVQKLRSLGSKILNKLGKNATGQITHDFNEIVRELSAIPKSAPPAKDDGGMPSSRAPLPSSTEDPAQESGPGF